MEQKLALRIGRASYSFYLLHQVVGISVLVTIASIGGWLAALIALPFVVAALVYVSTLIFDHIEQPANRWIVDQYKSLQQNGPKPQSASKDAISPEEEKAILRFVRRFD